MPELLSTNFRDIPASVFHKAIAEYWKTTEEEVSRHFTSKYDAFLFWIATTWPSVYSTFDDDLRFSFTQGQLRHLRRRYQVVRAGDDPPFTEVAGVASCLSDYRIFRHNSWGWREDQRPAESGLIFLRWWMNDQEDMLSVGKPFTRHQNHEVSQGETS